GYKVFAADGAEMALDLLKKQPNINMLLTDIVMPQTNGKRLSEQVQRHRPGIKVLFMTGYSRNAIIHNGVLDAGVALLNKPFTIDQLGVKVRLVLDSQTSRQ
ncbi:MAG: response regulator, partial [Chitinophagales bacterium]|nr:response regulator [Hyphomicrobiales bacterium]